MFKVATDPQFTHTVKVLVPVDGGHTEQTMKATYRVLSLDDIVAVDTSELDGQLALLHRAIVKLDDICGEDGQPALYSDVLRDQLLAVPYVRSALFQTYFAAVTKAGVRN